jgi:hypothetical protein
MTRAFATINAITADVLAIAVKLGLPPGVFVETVASGGADGGQAP